MKSDGDKVSTSSPKQEKVVVKIDPDLKTKINKGPPPKAITISSLKIKAPIDTIALADNGDLIPPDDAKRLGWWDYSAKPGSLVGQIVVTGHVLHNRKDAALEPLKNIVMDTTLVLHTEKRAHKYQVTRIEKISNKSVSARQQELFAQTRNTRGRLVLITCSDWNGRFYETNLFVFADLVE